MAASEPALDRALALTVTAAIVFILAHTTSLDVTGDHEHVVSYGAVAFTAGAA